MSRLEKILIPHGRRQFENFPRMGRRQTLSLEELRASGQQLHTRVLVPKSQGIHMGNNEADASKQIDTRIRELGDWRGKTLSKVRETIKEADPEIVEEWKWVKPTNPGTPVWSHNGGICTGEIYKNAVKLTFFKGAALNDPSGLFNSSLDGEGQACHRHQRRRRD